MLNAFTRTDWSNQDLEELERQWEADDDPEDLRAPDDEFYALVEKVQDNARKKLEHFQKGYDSGKYSRQTLEEVEIEYFNAGMPAMMFVKLRHENVEADDISSLCYKFAVMIACHIKCYSLDSNDLMVTVAKSWIGKDVHTFLLGRPEVLEVTWNDVTSQANTWDNV